MSEERDGPGPTPVDLGAVQADDLMVELIRQDLDAQEAEELALLLRQWRQDQRARALPELVTVDDAVETVRAGRRKYRWRRFFRQLREALSR